MPQVPTAVLVFPASLSTCPSFSLSPALEPAPPVSAPLFPSLPAVLKELLLCDGPPTYLFSAPSTPRPLQGLSDLCASEGVHRKSLHGQCQEPPCGPHDTLLAVSSPATSPTMPPGLWGTPHPGCASFPGMYQTLSCLEPSVHLPLPGILFPSLSPAEASSLLCSQLEWHFLWRISPNLSV